MHLHQYERLKRCMGYSFYSDSCEILYENDIKINENAVSVQAEYGAIEHAVKTGDMEKLKMLLSDFLKHLKRQCRLRRLQKRIV